MTAKLILRDARRDEVPEIVRMLVDDELGRGREALEGETVPQVYYDAFDAMATTRFNRLLVAERGGEIVGTLQLTFLHGLRRRGALRAQIEAVRVAGGHRGEGVGQDMMLAAIDMARAAGCALVQLTTDKSRKDAHRFYERLGFEASHVGMKLMLN
jgi:GNAT superfamily N-acetyltransferase